MMAGPQQVYVFTADEIEAGIVKALGAGDIDVVPGLVRLLARQDPGRAQAILDTIDLGISLSRADRWPE